MSRPLAGRRDARRLRRTATASVVLAAFWIGSARAALSAEAAPFAGAGTCADVSVVASGTADADPLFVDLTLNGKDEGSVFMRGSEEHPWLRESDLLTLGIADLRAPRALIAGQTFVSIAQACGNVTWKFDPQRGILDLDVNPRAFRGHDISAEYVSPDRDLPLSHDREAHLNYVLQRSGDGRMLASGTAMATLLGGIASVSGTAGQHGPSNVAARLTYDNDRAGTGLSVGDISPAGGAGAGAPRLYGVLYESRPELRPYDIHSPFGGLSGVATRDAKAALYVNGTLIDTYDLSAGPFVLNHIPIAAAGQNDARIVVTDALGQHIYDSRFFSEGQLLAKGYSDFQFALGTTKRSADTRTGSASGATFLGRDRIGITNSTTVGGRFETAPGVQDGGVSLDTANRIAGLRALVAGSTSQGTNGTAWTGSIQKRIGVTTLAASIAGQTSGYANVNQSVTNDRAVREKSVAARTTFGAYVFGASESERTYRDAGSERVFEFDAEAKLLRTTSIFGNISKTVANGRRAYSAFLGLNMPLGRTGDYTVRAASSSNQGATTRSIDITKGEATTGGLSYDVGLVQGAQSSSAGAIGYAQYRSPYGTLRADRFDSGTSGGGTTLSLAGSIVAAGRIVTFAPPIDDAYAIVDVGFPGVPVFSGGQSLGKTRGDGLLVVREPSNVATSLDLSLVDAPRDLDLAVENAKIRIRHNSGTVLTRHAIRLRGYQGTFQIPAGTESVVGTIKATASGMRPVGGLVGNDGSFYFENLPAGVWNVNVVYAKGEAAAGSSGVCHSQIVATNASQAVNGIGELPCNVSLSVLH